MRLPGTRACAPACSDEQAAGAAGERLTGGITREALERDEIRQAMHARHPEVGLLDDAALYASMQATLQARPPEADAFDGAWLFGYGSLLWNPCVAVAERRVSRLHGYHRDFRLQLAYGRGSPEAPGLMLGLVPGGSCRGVALRVPGEGEALQRELHMVWRREMLTGVYVPRWVSLSSAQGRVAAIAFVVNPQHECYCGRLDDNTVIERMATGYGMLGSAAEYLDSTVAHLEQQGIRDRRLRRLHRQVQLRASNAS